MNDPKKIIRQLKSELGALHKEIEVLKEKGSSHDRIKEALRESEEMYQKVLKTSPNAVTVTDLEGNIIEVSQRTLELHGFKHPKELIGKNVFELVIPEDREKAFKNLNKTIKDGFVKNIQYTLLKKDGSHFLGKVNATIINNAHAKPKALIVTTRDVTKQRLAEKF